MQQPINNIRKIICLIVVEIIKLRKLYYKDMNAYQKMEQNLLIFIIYMFINILKEFKQLLLYKIKYSYYIVSLVK